MKAILILLSLLFAGCQSQKSFCPSAEDIKPCLCKIGTDKKPYISCDGLASADELKKAVKGMKDYKLSVFYLEKSNIGVLPGKLFENLEIQTLNILFTNLTALSESLNRPAFIGLEDSLESLEIRDGFREENSPLSRLPISNLKKLNFLQLEGNLMPTVGNDWFESGPYGLREVYLLDTSTSVVGNHAFTALEKLRILSFTGGSISSFERTMFPIPALALQSLDFSNNKLASLPDNMFAQMPSLKEVFLDNNEFTTIAEVSWAPIWSQIRHVYFYGNPLVCDKNIKWIYKYRLPEYMRGICTSPPKLANRDLSNITISDLK